MGGMSQHIKSVNISSFWRSGRRKSGRSLFPHNQTAYENVHAMLDETGKAAVIHPTGTGKTSSAFSTPADHPQDRILWLAPSEYIFKTQMENWLSVGGDALPNITFLTYAKLSLMTESELFQFHSSLSTFHIVLDEFHRAGAAQWGLDVQRLLAAYPSATILGLSATNVRYLDGQRDMAQELFDGHIASEMSLGEETIVTGIASCAEAILSIFKYKTTSPVRAQHPPQPKQGNHVFPRKICRRALDLSEGAWSIFDRHVEDQLRSTLSSVPMPNTCVT